MAGGRAEGLRPAAATALLLIGTLVACGDRPSPDEVRAALRVIAAQPGELGRAEAAATLSCLRAKGFDPPPPMAESGAVQNLPVPVDERAARAAGYGDAIPRGALADGRKMQRYAESTPGVDQALGGPDAAPVARLVTPNGWEFTSPRTGCVAEGRAAVYGSVGNWLTAFYLPQDLNQTAADVYLDDGVATASAAYQSCMAGEGYHMRIPQEASETARGWAAAGDSPAAREIALATADARCRSRTGIAGIWYAEFERRAAPWLTRNANRVIGAAAVVREATATVARRSGDR
ncbi:hypothetical protein AB0M02_25800 [Actinoplanes sp. NPDC051861]|uniref:hypothetical protein n=1 Tax=Actinoplanes sp. NPDC051861 TaxID=3155170 RepID=UPI003445BE13